MPAGVSWSQYTKFFISAMLSMMAGSQLVHTYYKPLKDIDVYIQKEMESSKSSQPSLTPSATPAPS